MFVLDAIRKYAAEGRIALVYRDRCMTYAELDRKSDAFASWLIERFGEDRTPVVIYGHKEMDILPCMYGALKAGRAYVPVDITVPAERAVQICEDVKPKAAVDFRNVGLKADMVLDPEMLCGVFEEYGGRRVDDSLRASGGDFAYILFTSGSTGKPKGVPITVANIENLYREFAPWMESDGDVVLNQISYSFDVSVCSVYIGVARGMTLYTIDKGMVENLGELFDYLGRSRLAIWVSTPSFAEMCVPSVKFTSELMPSLEKFVFCGEVLTHKLADELDLRFPAAKVINTYGPTEATVLVTAVEIDQKMRSDETQIPIGYPLPEVTFRIVDENGNELAEGEQGELQIISDSVGPGYFGRPDLTERSFFLDEKTGKRGYRTGDSCFVRDRLYYYCGRLDNQIKLNGFRVEIEDVENNLVKVDNISRAAVLPVYEDGKVQYLAAFVLLEHPDGLSSLKRSISIKNGLAEFLPSYMVPRKITALPNFPLNTNGKVDKKELAKLL